MKWLLLLTISLMLFLGFAVFFSLSVVLKVTKNSLDILPIVCFRICIIKVFRCQQTLVFLSIFLLFSPLLSEEFLRDDVPEISELIENDNISRRFFSSFQNLFPVFRFLSRDKKSLSPRNLRNEKDSNIQIFIE